MSCLLLNEVSRSHFVASVLQPLASKRALDFNKAGVLRLCGQTEAHSSTSAL